MKLFKLPRAADGSCVAVNPYDVVSVHLKVKDKMATLEIHLSNGKCVSWTEVDPKEAMAVMDRLIEASDSAKEVAPEETTANTPA